MITAKSIDSLDINLALIKFQWISLTKQEPVY